MQQEQHCSLKCSTTMYTNILTRDCVSSSWCSYPTSIVWLPNGPHAQLLRCHPVHCIIIVHSEVLHSGWSGTLAAYLICWCNCKAGLIFFAAQWNKGINVNSEVCLSAAEPHAEQWQWSEHGLLPLGGRVHHTYHTIVTIHQHTIPGIVP